MIMEKYYTTTLFDKEEMKGFSLFGISSLYSSIILGVVDSFQTTGGMMIPLYKTRSAIYPFLPPIPKVGSLFSTRQSNDKTLSTTPDEQQQQPKIRIGIIGGGIAGVGVAHALATKYNTNTNSNFTITVLEGEKLCPSNTKSIQPNVERWKAATARNGNAIVPGASFHIFSKPSVLMQVLKDTTREWLLLQYGRITGKASELDIDESLLFDEAPPYFALHLFKCIGPSATTEERWSFIHFITQFLYATYMKGNATERGQILHQIASANRFAYLKEINENNSGIDSSQLLFGHSQGFISLHRTQQGAIDSAKQVESYGESAEIIDKWEDVLNNCEPRLVSFPQKLYAVKRLNDITASCENYVHYMINKCQQTGLVNYKQNSGKVINIEIINPTKTKTASNGTTNESNLKKGEKLFKVKTDNGTIHEFDYIVLAAGISTPLLASRLGLNQYCPTYPLRGFSLTFFVENENDTDDKNNKQKKSTRTNLLKQPFSVDSMYFTSVTPYMGRVAGFGEFVGYGDKKTKEVVQSVGPAIMSRYVRRLFPDATHVNAQDALQCFRPMSPDDIPIVGEIQNGLFIHTGHGTLGWTLGLATSDCVAQAIIDRIHGHNPNEGDYILPDGTKINRKILSPKRFVE